MSMYTDLAMLHSECHQDLLMVEEQDRMECLFHADEIASLRRDAAYSTSSLEDKGKSR